MAFSLGFFNVCCTTAKQALHELNLNPTDNVNSHSGIRIGLRLVHYGFE
jgi:hypothetical protein